MSCSGSVGLITGNNLIENEERKSILGGGFSRVNFHAGGEACLLLA